MRSLAILAIATVVAANGAEAAQAQASPVYRYVSLDRGLPAGFDFLDPVVVTDDGDVYGTAYACTAGGCVAWIARRHAGRTRVLQQGEAYDGNNDGVVGGSVLAARNPRDGATRAALFRGTTRQVLPHQSGDTSDRVVRITGTGIALVDAMGLQGRHAYLRRMGGGITAIEPPIDFPFFLDVNNAGMVSGTGSVADTDAYRAFSLDPPATLTQLNPVGADPQSLGLTANSRGDVLGYSLDFGARERIGFWRGTTFHTRFIEGTAKVPTISSDLLWNEQGLIVITDTSEGASYLVPAAGKRVDLADLADRLPPWTSIYDINARGDLVGFGGPEIGEVAESFLLQRVSTREALTARAVWRPADAPAAAARSTATARHLLPDGASSLRHMQMKLARR
ncbi:MAG: hypothetical protein U1E45_11465 [Geminicoccaceae bacterium]